MPGAGKRAQGAGCALLCVLCGVCCAVLAVRACGRARVSVCFCWVLVWGLARIVWDVSCLGCQLCALRVVSMVCYQRV